MQLTGHVPNAVARFMEDESAASPTEYVLVASLAAVVLGLAVLAIQHK